MNTSRALHYSRVLNTLLCSLGMVVSIYAVFVEFKLEVDKDYVALCDINQVMACSKVFSSKYARGFGLVGPSLGEDHFLNQPNGIYGAILYIILLVLSQLKRMRAAQVQRVLVFLANLMTPYLAYLLYKVIQAVCVLCVATYVINALLLCMALWRMAALNEIARKRKKKASKKD